MSSEAARDLAGAPRDDVPVPAAVRRLAAGTVPRPVWRNEIGGLTYELPGRAYVKWSPTVDLAVEAERLTWAGRFTAVPRVLEQGADEDGSWLVTAALPGRNAIEHPPAHAVHAVGAGLRALHEALPAAECPFSWEVADRLVHLHDPDEPGRLRVEHGVTPAEARRILADPPDGERVVCHGDACAPNTIVDEHGWTGHVDLGALGTGDRWADLAVATWSTVWNFGPGWEAPLLDAYGIAPDPDRTRYYRLLWDLT
ncbi:aminoglycoside 3'-phosphotransferase [Pseudonocardia pini]|uniref:aminoglycoside 3'-phosphotransferase n=1 Tax=Pseudonocardia pini TaxID=2758030 RepID=UPI0028A618C2|nr:aminoglycoside 3'-phosphotransferase [Pseudonocardia pini]